MADHFGLSLATITAGLVMGNVRSFGTISDLGKEAVQAFWDMLPSSRPHSCFF